MGHGLARIPRVGCDHRGGVAPGVSAGRKAAPHREGEEVEGATPRFLALVRHRGEINGPP